MLYSLINHLWCWKNLCRWKIAKITLRLFRGKRSNRFYGARKKDCREAISWIACLFHLILPIPFTLICCNTRTCRHGVTLASDPNPSVSSQKSNALCRCQIWTQFIPNDHGMCVPQTRRRIATICFLYSSSQRQFISRRNFKCMSFAYIKW